jgi:SAM-dependent methyltransferase
MLSTAVQLGDEQMSGNAAHAGGPMDIKQVQHYWETNAAAWLRLTHLGYDVLRDLVNTPAFLDMLPPVAGYRGLEIGCGDGYHTRLLAQRGAHMTAIDLSPAFLSHACHAEREMPLGVAYGFADAARLPFTDASFDFVVAVMSLMDMPAHERVLAEAYRVLRPGGFLQFSISHPCFTTPRWKWLRDAQGQRSALVCGDYFRALQGEVDEWTFGTAPAELRQELPKFRIPRFTRTLSSWLNLLVEAGFILEHFDEPSADAELARQHPEVADTRIIAYVLIVRCRKPGGAVL